MRRYIIPSVVALTFALTLAVVAASHSQHPNYSLSDIRMSSVRFPVLFFALGRSQVCLAALWLAAGSGKFGSRLMLLLVTAGLWSFLNAFYAIESMWAGIYFSTASLIGAGLSLLRTKPPFQSLSAIYRQFSIRHLLFATAWIATLIMLEKHSVARFGIEARLKLHFHLALPSALTSLFLFWAIMRARKGKWIYRLPIALGAGVAIEAVVQISLALIGYWETGRWSAHRIDLIPSSCVNMAATGMLISAWLLAVRLSTAPTTESTYDD